MKRCPQCNTVYEDSTDFCLNDGQSLVEEKFVLPSEESFDEEPTVIRSEPIIVDFGKTNAPTEQFTYQSAPAPTVIVEKKTRATSKFVYVLLGTLIGALLVTVAVILINRRQTTPATGNNQTIAVNVAAKTPKPASTEKNSDEPTAVASEAHRTRTDTPDAEFNGRVIAQNAYLRDAPDRTSKAADILPVDDRLTITNRKNENSPWYFVVCEHGKSGWMHGNTIEYTSQ